MRHCRAVAAEVLGRPQLIFVVDLVRSLDLRRPGHGPTSRGPVRHEPGESGPNRLGPRAHLPRGNYHHLYTLSPSLETLATAAEGRLALQQSEADEQRHESNCVRHRHPQVVATAERDVDQ